MTQTQASSTVAAPQPAGGERHRQAAPAADQVDPLGVPLRGRPPGKRQGVRNGHGGLHRVDPRVSHRAQHLDAAKEHHLDGTVLEEVRVRGHQPGCERRGLLPAHLRGTQAGQDRHTFVIYAELAGKIRLFPDLQPDQVAGAQRVGQRLLRGGPAGCYLRCDDEALLAAVVADRKVESLRLRRVAPTVVIAKAGVEQLLAVLRDAGYAPVAESPEGAVVITRPDARRTAGRPPLPRATEPPAVAETQLIELVRAVRAGDRALRSAQRTVHSPAIDVPGVTTATTLGLLRDAAAANQAVLLGYVNAQGTASQRIVEPASVNGGYLHGYDHQRDEMRTFALHRITTVSILPDEV